MENDKTVAGVGLQTLVLGNLPLIIASLPDTPAGVALEQALCDAGLQALDKVVGAELPLGAKVGFRVEAGEVRLADLDGDVLLKAARKGVDDTWVAAAVKLRGTMLVMVAKTVLPAALSGDELGRTLDACAANGQVFGAVVGVEEDRMRLPLLF